MSWCYRLLTDVYIWRYGITLQTAGTDENEPLLILFKATTRRMFVITTSLKVFVCLCLFVDAPTTGQQSGEPRVVKDATLTDTFRLHPLQNRSAVVMCYGYQFTEKLSNNVSLRPEPTRWSKALIWTTERQQRCLYSVGQLTTQMNHFNQLISTTHSQSVCPYTQRLKSWLFFRQN